MVHDAIYQKLTGTAAITAIVGSKIHQVEREQGEEPPSIVFDEISGESDESISDGSVGLAITTFQFDCHASTVEAATSLRDLVRLAFQNHHGLMGSGPGVFVFGCQFSGLSSGFDPDTGTYVRSVDFDVHHEQAQS